LAEEEKKKILWADDEIDLLRSHIIFLEDRGYSVQSVTNGDDAVAYARKNQYDLILLDEMMAGKDGITALQEIKRINPAVPVVMITKSEEEGLMDDAFGGNIDDFLTKPVNPSQIFSVCKKILEGKQIREKRVSSEYLSGFQKISNWLTGPMSPEDWIDVFVRLTEWELELNQHPDQGLYETLLDLKKECNISFVHYIERNYLNWIHSKESPCLSTHIVDRFIFPELKAGRRVFFIVLDSLIIIRLF